MAENLIQQLRAAMREIPDFPKPGILFRDITPILGDGALFRTAVDLLTEATAAHSPSKIVGIDARGFIFGAAVASRLNLGFIPVRKVGKLPFQTESVSYALEYGKATVEIHTDAARPGERIVLVDDLLATGGTSAAAAALVETLGAEVAGLVFLVELAELKGRSALGARPVKSLLLY